MSKSIHYQRVQKFMELAKQECPDRPTIPSASTRELRACLILEEAMETIEALGVHIYPAPDDGLDPAIPIRFEDLSLQADSEANLALIVDGCCDVSVVTVGTLIACGVPDQPMLALVDENNLAKFGPGHSIRADGKLVKPAGHRPPDIARELAKL